MSEFTLKRGDSRPVLVRQLLDGSLLPIDLTDADAVYFLMELKASTHDGTPAVRALCTIPDAAQGIVQWTPTTSDTQVAGQYDAEFEITWASGEVETIPNGQVDEDGEITSAYFRVNVVGDLG
jgi:hypothetical protein